MRFSAATARSGTIAIRQCEFLTAAELKQLSTIAKVEYACSSCRSDFSTNQLDYKKGLRRMTSYRDNPVDLKAAAEAEAVYLKRDPELVSWKLRQFAYCINKINTMAIWTSVF